MKTPLLSSPRRLLMNVLALAIAVGALSLAPPPTAEANRTICALGCEAWSQACGCYEMSYCCANSDTYWCSYSSNPGCNY